MTESDLSNSSHNDALASARSIIEETGVNLFLTGKAGTGKTTFLHSLSESTFKRHVVLAPTGVAAINAGGSTIHSFFQLSFAPFIPGKGFANGDDKLNKFRKDKIKILRSLDLLIIDEISMVRPDVLDAVDVVLRRFRNPLRPFGGVQLLLIGDLRQLAPVAQPQEWDLLKSYYASPYFFESHALKQAGFLMVELTKVYRQSDQAFVDILNRIRDNCADMETLRQLNARADKSLFPARDDGYIRLTSHNYLANDINSRRLAKLKGNTYTYHAKVTGNFPESSYPAEAALELKRGAQVMFIKNDISGAREYYNGLLGEVTDLTDGEVTVLPRSRGASPIKVGKVIWENMRYHLGDDGEIKEELEGSFEQIPLRAAWAITIHKSQGLTFDKAIVDASHSFAPGQAYVALSRCRSMEGLLLDSPLPPSAIMTDPAVNSFIANQPRMRGDEDELSQFRESYYSGMLYELFDFRHLDNCYDSFFRVATEVLSRDYPKFAASIDDCRIEFQRKVSDVASKMFMFLGRTMPYRADKEIMQRIEAKIAGGCGYFKAEMERISDVVKDTPLAGIDNKMLKRRLTDYHSQLMEQLELKKMLFEEFTDKKFDPQAYLAVKTKFVLREPKPAVKKAASRGAASSGVTSDIVNPGLYKKLMAWRKEQAGDRPAFTVMSNKVLIAISTEMPRDYADLLAIPGMGKIKCSQYGEQILEIVSEFVS